MKADTVTAICSIFIAACALAVLVWDSYATRDLNRRTAMPVLKESRDSLPVNCLFLAF